LRGSFSYYDVLGLTASATDAEIKAAYRSTIAKYHPDVNKAPNAQALSQMVNEAYETLADPSKRIAYDQSLLRATHAEPGATVEELELVGCDRCGQVDVGLRVAVFFRVWSLVLYSNMSPVSGVFCWKCRSRAAWQTALFTAFLGPWGIPWGVFYTIRAFWVAIRGGIKPRLENAQLLRHQGYAFAQRGAAGAALTALSAAQRFDRLAAIDGLLSEPFFKGASPLQTRRWLPGQTAALAIVLIPFVLLLVVVAAIGGDSDNGSQPVSYVSPSPSPTVNAERLTALVTMCRDGGSNRDQAQTAFDACSTILGMIHQMASSTPASITRQNLEIDEDVALFRQGIASDTLGKPEQARKLLDSSTADLRRLETSGTSPGVRHDAAKYYNCFAMNQCK
jgi:hypothetical protein